MTLAQLRRDKQFVRAIARSITPAHLLDDAVSEGLIGLLEARDRGISEAVVTRRRIVDFLRRESRQSRAAGGLDPDLVVAIDPLLPLFFADTRSKRRVKCGESLTDREYEILGLYARGMTYSQIGSHEHISRRTANEHLYQIRRKLGVRGNEPHPGVSVRFDLMEAAQARGIVRIELCRI